MAVRRVAVVGANGKTGRAVTSALHAREVAVTAIGRAELASLPSALEGADALYLIAPNMHEDEPAFVRRILAVARTEGVRRVAYHSVAAPYAPAMPHHVGKAEAENAVRTGSSDWTILQPCAYVQNFVPALRPDDSALRVAYSPRKPFGLVDLADVAEAAATVLLSDTHIGATYELGGPDLVDVHDVARAAGQVLGREVPVSRISVEAWRENDGSNLDSRVRDWLAAMFDYYDEHGLPVGSLPLTVLLGREPTPLEATLRRELRPAR
ncbi:SDR family oxidoreductase [Solicola gregarius]|uniref:NmrA family NAD(P)-binding protein n=1 Tax=Solicola gregarius TaxID=2908642 RepID=A0AA46YL27_9ACTN|nr:NmrA family NAD(P)-binding protein [Solicola gregarius]UYM06117.1 NmrA family NAD(P)-binding protein [Solicola gregarius]